MYQKMSVTIWYNSCGNDYQIAHRRSASFDYLKMYFFKQPPSCYKIAKKKQNAPFHVQKFNFIFQKHYRISILIHELDSKSFEVTGYFSWSSAFIQIAMWLIINCNWFAHNCYWRTDVLVVFIFPLPPIKYIHLTPTKNVKLRTYYIVYLVAVELHVK